ncbi:TIGR02281 family clan AA aspartic protease [Caulobacter hibisci]|uniref:TIGR02281 family clan AA aspartic protease n=1 Tax=Caulobacter hibisci TaxID=2035993 RepID=A0ABS0T4S4_9CAUL|nr:TIGR02281 family clan AA aspartic protease [Caulobacter hibisci]MBI1686884.1 TIGR02281 family clan AA aspartic protease [Caulobacter hibisci]
MSNPGPWGAPPSAESDPAPAPTSARSSKPSWRRWLAWLLLAGVIIAGLALLGRWAPWGPRDSYDWTYVLMWGVGIVMFTGALLRATRREALRGVGFAALWLVIAAVLGMGYLYRAELAEAPRRLLMALNVGAPVTTGEHELRVAKDAGGAFVIIGQVNGVRVPFLVDTGASHTVLSPADAQRIGIPVETLAYDQTAETANGLGYGAQWTADRLTIGPIVRQDFAMDVNKAPMSGSLLGMSFLDTLESYEVRDGVLILRWR